MFGFEKLEVWQRSVDYADHVYRLTEKFPQRELFGLVTQLRRAAVSVSSNIAEGSVRGSNKEFVRFIQIAYGSLMETVSQARIACNQELITDDEHKVLYEQAERVARMLSGLKSKLSQEP